MTKTNIRKRAISILLILMVMLTMTPMTASAAEPVWTIVNTFDELRNAMQEKTTTYIKLGNDIDSEDAYRGGLTVRERIDVKSLNSTLDLNGHTVTLHSGQNNTSDFIRVYGNLTIKDSGTNGEIALKEEARQGANLLLVQGSASLTLEGGKLSATQCSDREYGCTAVYCTGAITINGGELTSTLKNGAYGLYSSWDATSSCFALNAAGSRWVKIHGGNLNGYVQIPVHTDSEVEITDGTFDGYQRFVLHDGSDTVWSKPALKITGGSFDSAELTQACGHKSSDNIAAIISGGTFTSFKVSSAPEPDSNAWNNRFFVVYVNKKDLSLSEQRYYPYQITGGTFNKVLSFGGEIYPEFDPSYIYTLEAFKHLLNNSCVQVGDDAVYTYYGIKQACLGSSTGGEFRVSNYSEFKFKPITVIPNAWGMKSVTLDGTKINYAKDWKGGFEELNNDKAHTLKFTWKPLASELVNAGYSYNATCDRYVSGSSTPDTDENLTGTEYSFTIPAGADPKVYSFALHLNLKKTGSTSNVGIYSNEHIVKLVLKEAPAAPPTLSGKVYYTSGIVYDRLISTGTGNLPAGFDSTKLSYQWQHSTDSGSTWTDIDGATRGSYIPVAADMGENVRIRVKVTAEGYLGEIIGAPVKVSKAANDNTPAPPAVEAPKDDSGAYTKFVISDFNHNQEYVYTTSAPHLRQRVAVRRHGDQFLHGGQLECRQHLLHLHPLQGDRHPYGRLQDQQQQRAAGR